MNIVYNKKMKMMLLALTLICYLLSPARSDVAPSSGTVILTRNGVYSKSYTSGRVAVYGIGYSTSTDLAWGNICRLPSFHSDVSDVICHQLGYTGSSSWSYAAIDSYGIDASLALLNNVYCSDNNYLTLFQCQASTREYSSCTDSDDVGVNCYTTRIWDNFYNIGQIRLSNGTYANDGILEINCNGQWGTVCYNSWISNTEGQLICNQLGYSDYVNYDSISLTDQLVWISSPLCGYSDTCLTDCQDCPKKTKYCSSLQILNITCYSSSISNGISTTNGECGSITPALTGIIAGTVTSGVLILGISLYLMHIYYQHRKGNANWLTRLLNYVRERRNNSTIMPWNRNIITTTPQPTRLQPTRLQPTRSQPTSRVDQHQYSTFHNEIEFKGTLYDEAPPPYDPQWAPGNYQ